jgi:hypothetical protein
MELNASKWTKGNDLLGLRCRLSDDSSQKSLTNLSRSSALVRILADKTD